MTGVLGMHMMNMGHLLSRENQTTWGYLNLRATHFWKNTVFHKLHLYSLTQ